MRLRTLTARILARAALNLALVAVAAALFVWVQLRQEFESFLLAGGGARLMAAAQTLEQGLRSSGPGDRAAAVAALAAEYQATFLLVENDGTHLAGPRLTIPGEVLARLSGPGGPGMPPPAPPPGRPPAQPLFLVVADSSPSYWIGVRMPVPQPAEPPLPGTLLVASDSFLGSPFFIDPMPWLGLLAGVLLISAACWLPWVRRATRDVARIEAATAEIARGRFTVAIPIRRDDEIGRLAAQVGQMAAQLDALATAQTRFVSDAAHELRSPLARMSVALDILETRPGAAARHVPGIREDVEEMRRLTDGLLQLARGQLADVEPRVEPVSIADAIDRAVRREAAGASVRVEVDPALRAMAVPDALQRAVDNVVRNAVFHAGTAGPVTVTAQPRDGMVDIEVADRGPGVPEDELDRIFTPFYRLDRSRDRRSGGVGLGLAIVRAAMTSCRGAVSCRRGEPTGLVVTLSLPAGEAERLGSG